MMGIPKVNYLAYVVLINVLLSVLGLNIFIHQALFSFYAFVLVSIVLGIFITIMVIKNNNELVPFLRTDLRFFFLFIAYVFLNSLLNKQLISYHHTYWVSCAILFFSISILFPLLNLKSVKLISTGLLTICVFESVYCLLQYFKVLKSENLFFEVTGTLENPNVIAMFLAMCFPIIFVHFLFDSGKMKLLNVLGITLTMLALVLLKCRSAFIGIGVSSLIILDYKYNLILILKKERYRYALVATGLVIIIASAYFLYKGKQISADNRVKIWKNSIVMIKEKPWIGYGYGFFEQSYNRRKISHNTPQSEALEANGVVRIAYNEVIQHFVEGGIIGFIIFSIFLFFVLRGGFNSLWMISVDGIKKFDETKKIPILIAFSGIVSFLVMSLTNFTYQAIPVMGMFVIYCGIISCNSGQSNKFHINPKIIKIYSLIFFICGIYLLISQIQVVHSEVYNRRGLDLIKKGNIKDAIRCFKPLESTLSTHNLYWKNYGTALILDGEYKEAIRVLNEELKYTADADTYLKRGFCYEKMNQAALALVDYKNASYIDHQKIKPHFYMMRLYLNRNKITNAVLEARKILSFKVVNDTDEGCVFRRAANKLLDMVKNEI